MNDDLPPAGPPPDAFDGVFHVTEVRTAGDQLLYVGQPLVPRDQLMKQVWPAFRDADYEVRFSTLDRLDVAVSSTSATDERQARPQSGSEPGPGVPNGGTDPSTSVDVDRQPSTPLWVEPTSRDTYVLVAEPMSLGLDGIPWTNLALFVATVLSTLYTGTIWYHIDVTSNWAAILQAWPFTAAVVGVLATHELGHYVMSRYHKVEASLPYFIPLPLNPIMGTMGAVIWMKGRMPDRKALFDIGVAGPLAGLVATVVVTAIGLWLSPVPVPQDLLNNPNAVEIHLGFPPLMYMIAWATGQSLNYGAGMSIHPIVIGGWVGMFVTFLNMIPVGQLDGGHIVRAILGDTQETVAALVPGVLFALAGYLYLVEGLSPSAVAVWGVWGVFATFLAYAGPATPIDDGELDRRRQVLGVVTIVLGLLCFTPVPVAIVS